MAIHIASSFDLYISKDKPAGDTQEDYEELDWKLIGSSDKCTSCKHYKQGHICALTSESTSKSRAYKTDKDDCFDSKSFEDLKFISVNLVTDYSNCFDSKDGK